MKRCPDCLEPLEPMGDGFVHTMQGDYKYASKLWPGTWNSMGAVTPRALSLAVDESTDMMPCPIERLPGWEPWKP